MNQQLAHIPCQKCQKPVAVKLHAPKVLNFENVSLVVVEHAGQSVCPCGATVVPFIAQLGTIGLIAAEVPPDQQSDIIIPPGSMGV